MAKQMEFFDEELSRTYRQIQELLSTDPANPRLDQLFLTCGAYIEQMQREANRMSYGAEKKQWKEILMFRSETFRQLQRTVHEVNF